MQNASLFATRALRIVALVAGLVTSSFASELKSPAKIHCQNQQQAFFTASVMAAANQGKVVLTSGTHSMEPLIHGKVYAVIQKQNFSTIAKSDILVYLGRPNESKPDRQVMLHRAVDHDSGGWIMSGDNNRWSEKWDRVTPNTYMGTVVALVEFSQT